MRRPAPSACRKPATTDMTVIDTTEYVFPPTSVPSLPVAGTNLRFPIHRVYCLGRNYADHAKEMGAPDAATPGTASIAGAGRPARPMLFAKPPDAVCTDETIPYPPATNDLQHEIELVAAIGEKGSEVDVAGALGLVFGYAVGIDLTRRDLQLEAKERRHPWDMAKGFDYSAPCSAIHPVAEVGHPRSGEIALDVNGSRRQTGDLSDQIWTVAQAIAALSTLVKLAAGDLLFMGTPAGVGSVAPGDVLDGHIESLGAIQVRIGPRP